MSFLPDREVCHLYLGRGQWEAACTRPHKVPGITSCGEKTGLGTHCCSRGFRQRPALEAAGMLGITREVLTSKSLNEASSKGRLEVHACMIASEPFIITEQWA